MTTRVEIASNALLMLGAQQISSFDEATDRAVLAANLYPMVRDDLLRSHPWNCAVKRILLAPEVAAPAFGYAYSYVLPSDWLRTLAVGEDGEEIDYRHESGRLLADENPLKLRYVWRNEDEQTWDAGLIQCQTLGLAARMAYALTQSAARTELVTREYEIALKRARAVDGQDDPPQTLGNFHLLASRRVA